MVAYSFQKQFVEPILSGIKQQTIRAVGKRRHAQPGDALQLYTGMRTQHCKLIARATCVYVGTVTLFFAPLGVLGEGVLTRLSVRGGRDGFARMDGFADWEEMKGFWRKHHPGVDKFEGVLIRWDEIRT